MIARSLGVHIFLFVGSAVLGLRAWTSEDETNTKPIAAELWSGRPTELQRIEFRTDKKLVVLEPKQDEAGRYFVGTVETQKPPPKPAQAGADAGAPAAHADPHAPPEEEVKPMRFISLDKAKELAEGLASLDASRVLGKVPPERMGEFGFDKTDFGTLKVVIGGKEHTLALGDKTPGGSDRYVRDPESGEAYVIAGSIANDLSSADNRLVEREFHDFGDEKVTKVIIKGRDSTREIVRHAEEKDFWARPDSPTSKDETVSNWMTKVDRLRVTNYIETLEPAPAPEDQVVRVEYLNERGKSLGFIEIVRRPVQDAKGRPEYVAKSERTRWYANVLRSTAEQIDQDLASVLAP